MIAWRPLHCAATRAAAFGLRRKRRGNLAKVPQHGATSVHVPGTQVSPCIFNIVTNMQMIRVNRHKGPGTDKKQDRVCVTCLDVSCARRGQPGPRACASRASVHEVPAVDGEEEGAVGRGLRRGAAQRQRGAPGRSDGEAQLTGVSGRPEIQIQRQARGEPGGRKAGPSPAEARRAGLLRTGGRARRRGARARGRARARRRGWRSSAPAAWHRARRAARGG